MYTLLCFRAQPWNNIMVACYCCGRYWTYLLWLMQCYNKHKHVLNTYILSILKTCLLVLQTLPVGHMVDKTLHRVVNVWWYINHHMKFTEFSLNETWKAKGIWNGPTLTWNILRLLLMSMVIYHHLYCEKPIFFLTKRLLWVLETSFFLSLD